MLQIFIKYENSILIMPHQCLNCQRIFDNSSDAIIKGCPYCGGKLFLYIKKIPENKEEINLTKNEKELIIKEVENITDVKNIDTPIILKLENIRIVKSGKYEIDINQLMKKNKPAIFKIQDGTYVIDLDFLRENKKNEEKITK